MDHVTITQLHDGSYRRTADAGWLVTHKYKEMAPKHEIRTGAPSRYKAVKDEHINNG